MGNKTGRLERFLSRMVKFPFFKLIYIPKRMLLNKNISFMLQ